MSSPFEPVLLTLPSLAPALALEVLPKGLTFHRLYIQADGRTHDILIGPEKPEDHAHFPYTNTIIGRYTNRLPVGSFPLGGVPDALKIAANKNSANPKVMLHGGEDAFDGRTFARLDLAGKTGEVPTLFSPKELERIAALPAAELWAHTSPAGDEGFPGALRVEVLTALLDAPTPSSQDAQAEYPLGAVVINYRAKLVDGASTPTPVNLTQHWGFNLDASLNARKSRAEREKAVYGSPLDDVRAHTLAMPADATVGLDADALSTGKLEPVSGGRDFTGKGKTIGEGWPEGGYDEFYAWEKPVSLAEGKLKFAEAELGGVDVVGEIVGAGAPVMTTLAGAKSGLKVEFRTNQSGVQFYTANFYDRSNARKKIHGGTGVKATGDGYGPGAAAFLEFHEPLAAFLPENAGTVRNGFDTLVAPGEIYNNWVRADVICKSVPEEDV